MTSSPRALPDTGRPSTIFAGPSIKATPPSACRPTTADFSTVKRIPLLANIRLADDVMANVIDALSFEQTPNGRRYINYRDLGVQQLGSIYERLLEHEIVRDGNARLPSARMSFARKGSGSYYTPDDLVSLIIKETIEPLVRSRMDDFTAKHSELATSQLPAGSPDRPIEAGRSGREAARTESLRPRHGLGALSGQPSWTISPTG